jgi:hypothetical protein
MYHVEFSAVAMRDQHLTIVGNDLISSALAALDLLTMYSLWPSTYTSTIISRARVMCPTDCDDTSNAGITVASAENTHHW